MERSCLPIRVVTMTRTRARKPPVPVAQLVDRSLLTLAAARRGLGRSGGLRALHRRLDREWQLRCEPRRRSSSADPPPSLWAAAAFAVSLLAIRLRLACLVRRGRRADEAGAGLRELQHRLARQHLRAGDAGGGRPRGPVRTVAARPGNRACTAAGAAGAVAVATALPHTLLLSCSRARRRASRRGSCSHRPRSRRRPRGGPLPAPARGLATHRPRAARPRAPSRTGVRLPRRGLDHWSRRRPASPPRRPSPPRSGSPTPSTPGSSSRQR